ncbi:hypothetical protein EYF80_009103 [Liparis tanakae]|uniref:Uncharacterized protein n=1 Tax=Liparis tanakae TaxID=230148 RepID=A0A4Z2IS61_9TELE|nr:hypothetical protein EYF80_009103 [Liparis tanakae]
MSVREHGLIIIIIIIIIQAEQRGRRGIQRCHCFCQSSAESRALIVASTTPAAADTPPVQWGVPVLWPQPGVVRGGPRVQGADVLPGPGPVAVEVEAVAGVGAQQVAQARSELGRGGWGAGLGLGLGFSLGGSLLEENQNTGTRL